MANGSFHGDLLSDHKTTIVSLTHQNDTERSLLQIECLSHEFPNGKGGSRKVIDSVSLRVLRGEIAVLLGPSGCGKSTILRAVAGLLKPTSGQLFFDGSEICGPGSERAMVFQNYTCFPFLTVEDNVTFGLTLKGMSAQAASTRATEFLAAVNMKHLSRAYPRDLSGGERQRVAIARSLAVQPRLLLMDEPFSSLDGLMRRQLQDLLLALKGKETLTCLFVTHSVEEAVYLGSKIFLMSAGPTDVKKTPATLLDEIHVSLPHPRSQDIKTDKTFEEIEQQVNTMIRKRAYVGC
jgi:ABC-type nitrate/sulfonate/bicarbonate transport system ATPase subunit